VKHPTRKNILNFIVLALASASFLLSYVVDKDGAKEFSQKENSFGDSFRFRHKLDDVAGGVGGKETKI
jgi:hypothetical protein